MTNLVKHANLLSTLKYHFRLTVDWWLQVDERSSNRTFGWLWLYHCTLL